MGKSEDEERFKRLISGAKGVPPRSDHHERYQREIGKIFESFFTKTGLNVRKLDEILVQERDEIGRNFREEVANAAEHFPSAQAIFRHDIEARRTALAILAKPFLSTFITLDMPSDIFEYPQWSPAIIDTHYESFNNWVKIKLDEHGRSDRRWFGFSFPWTNESDFFAVINISSFLVLNGHCQVNAAGGWLSSDTATLNLYSRLDLKRESGWGSDPLTGDGTWAVQNNTQKFNTLEVSGNIGGPFGGSKGLNGEVFQLKEIDHTLDLFVVPGRAQIIVFVALDMEWYFTSGNSDNVAFANFADDNLLVLCPFVRLELLTAPP